MCGRRLEPPGSITLLTLDCSWESFFPRTQTICRISLKFSVQDLGKSVSVEDIPCREYSNSSGKKSLVSRPNQRNVFLPARFQSHHKNVELKNDRASPELRKKHAAIHLIVSDNLLTRFSPVACCFYIGLAFNGLREEKEAEEVVK